MRVLHFPSNSGNHPAGLVRAERTLGIKSDLVTLRKHVYGYEADRCYDIQHDRAPMRLWKRLKIARELIDEYDVFHFNGGETFVPGSLPLVLDLWWLRRKGKRTFVTFQGTDARLDSPVEGASTGVRSRMQRAIKRVRIAQISRWATATFCLNPDLLKNVPSSEFMAYASVDATSYAPGAHERANRPLRLVHAPSRRTLKGTAMIEQAVAEASKTVDVELDIVESLTHAAALDRYRQADVAIDQLLLGWYGGFALECMALGMPVIAYIEPAQRSLVPNELGTSLPIVSCTSETLAASIIELAETPLDDLQQRSRSFALEHHDPVRIAELLAQRYGYTQ